MQKLWLYNWLSQWSWLNYRAKIMLMAFVGTHIPLIALIGFYAARTATDWETVVQTVGVALVATLIGTGMTLFVLNHLLRPVLVTSKALRAYRHDRTLTALPTQYSDEVGTLMSDASHTLNQLDAKLDDLMFIDRATGVANRDRLLATVQDRVAQNVPFAVCTFRLANFDVLAKTFDAAEMDGFARILSARLVEGLAQDRRLARVAPDAFAFVADGGGDAGQGWAEIAALMQAIQATAAGAIVVDGVDVRPVLQAGMALFPDDAGAPETLLDHAIAAASLATPSAPVVFHSADARKVARDRFRVEQELRTALRDEQFVLHYQPVIDLSLGRTIGAEALIRWQHPERGLVPPGQFIGIAETSGLIDPIGLWVMQEACRQAREWSEQGLGKLSVAVNLSARQFLDSRLLDLVRASIETSGIDADQLELELTETVAMVDYDHTHKTFTALRDLGVSIAIDDFGTGYASLSSLRKLPFDKLKIDREFVSNVHQARGSQAICGALVELSNGLGLRVLAEGTECEAEVLHLFDRGCHLFQGFHFSRPVEKSAFPAAVRDLSVSKLAMQLATRNAGIQGGSDGLARAG